MFGLFQGNKPVQQQAQQQPPAQQQGQSQGQPSASGANTNTAQEQLATPNNPQLPPNPLDTYTKLWETANQGTEAPPAFAVDSKVINEVSSSMDFVRNAPEDLMTAAQNGDMKAIMGLMNHAARKSYEAALSHGTALTDKYLNIRSQHDQAQIGHKVKSEMVSASFADIPNSSHPVVKQELRRIADGMQKMNPDMRPEEIVAATKEYFINVQNAMNGTGQQQQQQKPDEDQWDKFFS